MAGAQRTWIAPSVLAADFGHLAAAVKDAERGGADLIHLDIMDGRFVPNISFGPTVVQSIRKFSSVPLDAHLMILEPERYVSAFQQAGAAFLTVHVEACAHLQRTVAAIRELGMKPGVSLNPSTPLSALEEILPELDLVLVMSVNPGFAGQQFIPSSLPKIARLRKMIDRRGLSTMIQVDGGIGLDTVGPVVRAGADILVAGQAVFGAKNIVTAMRSLRRRADAARVKGAAPRRQPRA